MIENPLAHRFRKAGLDAKQQNPIKVDDKDSPSPPGTPVEIPITGELDLHTFRPRDVKEVVGAYLDECRKRGILTVRVVHGKGIGNLRRTVHALLERMPEVESFALASEPFGGWGATMVCLRPMPSEPHR